MKYAIAQTSGKQFLVKPGEWYDIDFIRNGEVGDYIYLNKILFFRNENKIPLKFYKKSLKIYRYLHSLEQLILLFSQFQYSPSTINLHKLIYLFKN